MAIEVDSGKIKLFVSGLTIGSPSIFIASNTLTSPEFLSSSHVRIITSEVSIGFANVMLKLTMYFPLYSDSVKLTLEKNPCGSVISSGFPSLYVRYVSLSWTSLASPRRFV